MPYLVEPTLDSKRLAGLQPEIESAALLLRRWVPSDAEQLVSAYSDAAIRHWNLRTLESTEEAERLIHAWKLGWRRREAASWAVVRRDNPDKILGQVGFRSLYLVDAMAEVSYWVVPGQRRRGLASAATRALSEWAFREIDIHRLELVHSVRNPGSCRVAWNAGFAVEGVKRQLQRHSDGWHDMCLHSRIQEVRRTLPLSRPPEPLRMKVAALIAGSGGVGGRSVGLQAAARTAARG